MDVCDIIDRYYKKEAADGLSRAILLTHSRQVAEKAVALSRQHPALGIDEDFVRRAAMLHDIGICCCAAPSLGCYGTAPYLRHGLCGAHFLRNDGWDQFFSPALLEQWAHVCERHTGAGLTKEEIVAGNLPLPAVDFLPVTLEEKVICYADKFFSKTHLDREKSTDEVLADMQRYSAASYQRFLQLHALFR